MLTDHQYLLLGKFIHAKYPYVVKEFISDLPVHLTYTKLISDLVPMYCRAREINIENLKKQSRKQSDLEEKIIFCGLVLKLYQYPALYDHNLRLKHGLRENISDALDMKPGSAGNCMKNARYSYYLYRSFREQVNEVYFKIINNDY